MTVLKKSICVLFVFFTSFQLIAQPIDDVKLLTDITSYVKARKGVTFEMQSSYDRTGGNDDGFAGTYSILRKEGGNSVISETDGAGVITRIWFPFNAGFPNGPMSLIGKRIFIYLDGNEKAAIDLPIIEMFNNTNPNFPHPLCGMVLGGCFSNLPIAFNNGAKIVVEGDKVGFFQVQFTKQSSSEPLQTFVYENNPIITHKKEVMDILWNTGDVNYLKLNNPITVTDKYAIKKGENNIDFLKGEPTVLRSFIVKGSSLNLHKFMEGRLMITWDDQRKAAIDVPLSMFFIQENEGIHSRSLLAGLLPGGGGVYNFFPMPYEKSAKVKIIAPEDCEVEITTIFEKDDFKGGYLHTSYIKEFPTTPGKRHVWLDVKGKGHYVGVYMRAAGESLSDNYFGTIYWTGCLEGDEVFEVDGKIVSHGTGTEDYFNTGWNGQFGRLNRAETLPFHGYTLFDSSKSISKTAAYRWHLPTEVIPFTESLKGSVEVGPADQNIGNYESISYYYKFK